jgi:hypothetical protein
MSLEIWVMLALVLVQYGKHLLSGKLFLFKIENYRLRSCYFQLFYTELGIHLG